MRLFEKPWLLIACAYITLVLLSVYVLFYLSALAVIAPEINTWPALVLVPTVALLTILALLRARTVDSKLQKILVGVLAFPPLLLCGSIAGFDVNSAFSTIKETYLIPANYQGEIYVFHGVKSAPSDQTGFHARTYKVDAEGFAASQEQIPTEIHSVYTDILTDGTLRPITHEWFTTIPDTSTNRNDLTRGVYFPRTGSSQDAHGCKVEYEEVTVGSKQYILSQKRADDLWIKLRNHPEFCLR